MRWRVDKRVDGREMGAARERMERAWECMAVVVADGCRTKDKTPAGFDTNFTEIPKYGKF